MQWVEGWTLFEWAADRCRRGDAVSLRAAAETSFRAWCESWRARRIVHAVDLIAAGNILIAARDPTAFGGLRPAWPCPGLIEVTAAQIRK